MILAKGKLLDSSEQAFILSGLEAEINHTRATKTLAAATVVAAIDKLSQALFSGAFDEAIARLELDGMKEMMQAVSIMLRRENMEYKLKTELGDDFFSPQETSPPFGQTSITIRPMPLGTLLHIAAGNVDGLPAFSVAEGLLTGNVNLLKLPQADNGLSIEILRALIEIEPQLCDFIYVFDTPSSDLPAMKQMAELADGIVVWGGDSAVSAVRQFAPVGAKLIEWGHKLGFAYLSGGGGPAELTALAEHILSTKQLLCSSCQTIFIDSDCLDELYRFCKEFLPYLEAAACRHPTKTVGAAAEITLRRYSAALERVLSGDSHGENKVFQAEHCSLTACTDSELELSDLFGNCLVKRLPKAEVFACLRKHKGNLQTAGLLCPDDKRAELADLLARCGVNRVTTVGDMSAAFCGEAHDGEYPLRRYTRFVNIE